MTEQIKLLYEKVADKTLSFGCLIRSGRYGKICIYLGKREYTEYHKYWLIDWQLTFETDKIEEFTIIGHLIHIGHCLDFFEKKYPKNEKGERNTDYFIQLDILFDLWKDKTLYIDAEVNMEALDYMCNLCGVGQNKN